MNVPSGFEIRPIRPEEHAAEAAILHAAYLAGAYGPELEGNREWLAVENATAARDAAGRVLVAVESGAATEPGPGLLGAMTVLPGGAPFTKATDPGEAELRLISVHPEAQGRGIGAALVRAGLELSLRWGAEVVRLDTGLRNPAFRLYERLGFVRTPERDDRVRGSYGASLSYEYPLRRGSAPRIREIRDSEVAEVGALLMQAYRDDYPQLGEEYLAEIAAVAERAAEHLVWVAEDPATGEILGTVTTPRPGGRLSDLAQAGELEVRLLGVAQRARGRGVGQALMRHCRLLARIRGEARVVLNTSSETPAAQRVYERLGFERLTGREREIVLPDGRPVTLLAYSAEN